MITADRAETKEQAETQRQLMATLIAEDYDYTRPRRREVREATVVSVEENELVVDLGTKRDGIVPPRDLERLNQEYLDSVQVGDRVPVYILNASHRQDGIIVSLNKGLAQQDWLRAEELLESQECCEAEVTAVNRGGVVTQFGRVRGFVPNSHLTSIRRGWSGERLAKAKSELVGRTLSVVVIEVNQRRQRLVLSERTARRIKGKQLFEELSEGDVREGIVCNIVDYGAFVDLGGADGLIHVSELDWTHVAHPSQVLSVGETVEVHVLKVDRERERISLSRKKLLPDPWPIVTESLLEGQVVEGTITKVVDFGAFVDIGQGVEGLVHISEMPDGEETRRNLNSGAPIQVQVLNIDPWRRRISLSARVAVPAMQEEVPEEEVAEEEEVTEP